jgi:hypothetical protein
VHVPSVIDPGSKGSVRLIVKFRVAPGKMWTFLDGSTLNTTAISWISTVETELTVEMLRTESMIDMLPYVLS